MDNMLIRSSLWNNNYLAFFELKLWSKMDKLITYLLHDNDFILENSVIVAIADKNEVVLWINTPRRPANCYSAQL